MMVPENLKSKDTIFHYCKSQTAIEYILFNKEIKLSPRKKSIDPLENSVIRILKSVVVIDEDIENRTEKESQELYDFLYEREETVKQACFCLNDESKNGTDEYYGFLKPRMWDQYGDNYKGVCIAFDKKKLLENSIIELRKDIKYLTYNDLNKYDLDINHNILYKIGVSKYRKQLIKNQNQLFLRKHIDYKDEKEFRICAFDKNEYINIKNSINGIIIIPKLINKYTQECLVSYSKELKIPLLYLTLDAEGFNNIEIEPHSDILKIIPECSR